MSRHAATSGSHRAGGGDGGGHATPELVVEAGLCDELFFSTDGGLIVCRPREGGRAARLWSLATGEEAPPGTPFEEYRHGAPPSGTSPDGRLVARAEYVPDDDAYFNEYHVVILDARTGERLHRFEGFGPLAFTPDGKSLLAVGSVHLSTAGALNQNRGALAVWDVSTGRRVRDFPDVDAPTCIALSPDGRTLAAAVAGTEGRRPIKLYDFETGRELRSLAGHPRYGGHSGARLLAFSPDGRMLASANAETEVRLWDVRAGEELCDLRAHRRNVTALAFHPGGRLLATASEDGCVRVWDVCALTRDGRGGEAGGAAAPVSHNFIIPEAAYKVAGRYAFSGDLIVTPRSAYYFPQRGVRHDPDEGEAEKEDDPDELISLFGDVPVFEDAGAAGPEEGGRVYSETLLREAVSAGAEAEQGLDRLLEAARRREFELSRRKLMPPFRVPRGEVEEASLSSDSVLRLRTRGGGEHQFLIGYDGVRAARAAFGLAAPDHEKSQAGGDAPKVPASVFPCPRCREFIRYGVKRCRWCKSPVDSEAAAAAYAREERLDEFHARAVVSAYELVAWFSLPLRFYFVGLLGVLLLQLTALSEVRGVKDFFMGAALRAALVFLPLSPVLAVFWLLVARWHLKYGRVPLDDPATRAGRRLVRNLRTYLIILTVLTAAVWLAYAYGEVALPPPRRPDAG